MKCPSCGTDNPSDAHVCTFCATPLASSSGDPFGETRAHAPIDFGSMSPGDLIANRYQVVRELGRGGMGVVYLVRDQKLQNKQIALKLISPVLVRDDMARQRFVSEVIASQEMTHQNIIKVFHLDEQSGQDFFTMEYLPGKTLREWIAERQKKKQVFSLEESIGIIISILSALEHAHSKKIIHRDLKPENVIVGNGPSNPEIKVVDFGLAKVMSPSRLTSSAMAMGTAYYMSPEQLAGKGNVDERSDIFSVGVILYELLTGKIPTGLFKLPSALLRRLPAAVDDIIVKSLATDPEDRFQNVHELKMVVNNLLDETQHPEKKSGKTKRTAPERKQSISRKAKIVSIIGAVIAIVVVSLVFIFNNQKPDAPVVRDFSAHDKPARPSLPDNTKSRSPFVHPETLSSPAARRTESKPEKPVPSVPEIKKYALTIRPVPSDAEVRILNIDPLYYGGIQLDPGRYHVVVSKSGYETSDTWVELKARDSFYPIALKKISTIPESTIVNTLGMKFVYIKPGTFMMGSPTSEPGRRNNETQHEVTLTMGYYMQTTEVTQGEWKRVMEFNPSGFPGCGEDCPVEQISWNDAQAFILKLNAREGINKYDLPTEAQWEYACRAGSTAEYCFGAGSSGLDRYSWYAANSGNKTHRVAEKRPNAWGLYDMHGNVWEWCSDRYGGYLSSPVSDPEGPSSGVYRVLRGGSWSQGVQGCRCASRSRNVSGNRYFNHGIRLVRRP